MASRWEQDRYPPYERERERDRYYDDRASRVDDRASRIDDRDEYYSQAPAPTRRYREHSDERYDRGGYHGGGGGRDDDFVRDRRYYGDERDDPRYARPQPQPERERDFDRRVYIDREREYREPSPPRRPTMLRRQSSLDTFDRRPPLHFLERERREEYGPPARREDFRREREDYRAPAYVPIPLPRSRQLPSAAPPPGPPPPQQRYDEIQIAEPGFYGDEEFRGMPERVREREVYRSSGRRRRDRSRDSRTTRTYSHRSSSRSSSVSSRTSDASGGTAIRNEYPKKGKTRIPARLVEKRALIELGYPYTEEGNTVIVLKALGQDNIDELLKLSEEFKKSALELVAARSAAGNIIEERREEIYTLPPPPPAAPPVAVAPPPAPVVVPAPAPAPAPAPVVVPAPAPAPVVVEAPPPPPPAPVQTTEVVKETVIRDVSPSRSVSSATTHGAPVYYERYSNEVDIGPLAVARHRSVSQPRSSRREIKAEIKALEAELRDTRLSKRHASRHRGDRDIVHAERTSDGALVLFEERVEKVEEGHRGLRIEKDKKGRMAISVPKYY